MIANFPETKYMGSKRLLLPAILGEVEKIQPRRVLDAFSGSACVSYGLKTLGIEVHSNDFLQFASTLARATVKNNDTTLTETDLRMLLRRNRTADDFVQRTFADLYFSPEDNAFLDNLWANIQSMNSPLKRSLALAAACRAAMKKRPRGIFTFTGKKGWDGRRDLQLTMREQFLSAARAFNAAVFSNRRRNEVFQRDVFHLDPSGYDLVYIDTPYVSPFSDCDYTRRYHFVEGYCSYWKRSEILSTTTTRKIKSYTTAFSSKKNVTEAFDKLFNHFHRSALIVSYSSNAVPAKKEMIELLRRYKQNIRVIESSHRYSFGNQRTRLGSNKNLVTEYLFVAE